MATQSDISIDEIRDYLVKSGGKVSNRELVKHFKKYLTHPDSKDDARVKFKEYVNQLATTKTEDNERYVIIRKRYITSLNPPLSPPPTGSIASPSRQPPPYRPPPDVKSPTHSVDSFRDDVSLDNVSQCSEYSLRSNMTCESYALGSGDGPPPQVPPRRKSQDKLKTVLFPVDNVENVNNNQRNVEEDANNNSNEDVVKSVESSDNEQKVSVRERTQKFNRLASETDVKPTVVSPSSINKKPSKTDKGPTDEDDGASVTSLDSTKTREWVVKAAKGDYQGLAKLVSENPRLVRYKTALHWAAKHGNENIVKLLAGTYHADVNARTNGGYTPLHIAMQFGHTNIYELLLTVYKADPQIHDWSGRKALGYVQTKNQSVSNETFRKIKARRKQSEKDTSFLRIGSLNVRVKKTTEAFSNFLGVGSGGTNYPSQHGQGATKVHKSWGSADNLPEKAFRPPKYAPVKKRKSKRPQDFTASHSTPGTPNQARAVTQKTRSMSRADSDSDTACGFDSNWQTTLDQ